MESNIISANFGGYYKVMTDPAWLVDHGMQLAISGIDLPDEFECHFSNSRSVAAKRQIGSDGVVTIPDEYFLSGEQQIFCWIYLHPTVDSGVTEYEICIPLRKRPTVDPAEPTQEQQDIVDQAIAALNVAMAATSADAESASESATAASNSASAALTSEQNASASASAAAGSASSALASQNAAAQSATAAANSASVAAQSERNAAASATAAAGSATMASTKATEAANSATAASNSATAATNKAGEAATSATNAANSANTASAKAGEAVSSATAASGSASTASTKAGEASASATAAAGSATAASGSATSANTNALKAEGYAVGQQNGADVESGSPYYENNAKYYSEEAAASAASIDPDTLAKIDGSYSSLTAGNAEQLVSTVGVNDKTPYLFRTTGGSADVGDRVKLSEITGGTVAWNQLVNTGDTSVTVPNGHKYYSRINSVQTIGASTGAAISINDASEDNVFDLTAMFGSTIADYLYSLEQNTTGAGVAWFKKLFPKDYYAYDAGSLLSVKTSAHKTIGFNQWDKTNIEDGYVNDTTGAIGGTNKSKNTGYIRVVGGATYHVRTDATSGRWGAWYDSDKNYISSANPSLSNNMNITAPQNAAYLRSTVSYRGNGNPDTFCINLHWDGERDGEYEPYVEYNYPLDSDLELRGIPKLGASNNLYYDGDSYAPDGTVTRKYATRSYEAGDATDGSTMITDGTNTVYKLDTPTTESADPYQETQVCNDFGTEEFVDSRTVPMPVGANALYQANLRAKLEMAPDSPDGDGDYIVRQTDGLNEYVAVSNNSTISGLSTRCPDCPTDTDGTFVLKATVSSGTVTYAWTAE